MDEHDDQDQETYWPKDPRTPTYWTNQDLQQPFDEREPIDSLVPIVQSMFDSTWKDIVTRDRQGGKPDGLEVISVERFEDQNMWSNYIAEKEKIRRKRGPPPNPTPVHLLDGNPNTGVVLTDKFIAALSGGEGLDQEVNEHYLFHGTSPEAAEAISEDGFRINLAGSNAGVLFGKGAYFAECSSKADEYSVAGGGKQVTLGGYAFVQDADEYAILLSRVCMGKVLRAYSSKDKKEIEKKLKKGMIDSVLGDREEKVGTYREFIVYREAQIYPEYRVIYRRTYGESSASE